MARVGVSYNQVAKAADELVGEGKQPTTRLIRARLGTGSPNTIQRHLTAWFNARSQAMASELPALTATNPALKSECDALVSEGSQQTESLTEQATLIEQDQHAVEVIRIELATAQLKIESQAENLNELIRVYAQLAE